MNDRRRDPDADAARLRERLDGELAGLVVTDRARRRLAAAIGTRETGGAARSRPRWPVLAVATAVAAVIAVPVLAARELRPGPTGEAPATTVVVPGVGTARATSTGLPGATDTTRSAPSTSAPTPSTTTVTATCGDAAIVLSVAVPVTRLGRPVVVTVGLAPATSPQDGPVPTARAAVPASPRQAVSPADSPAGSPVVSPRPAGAPSGAQTGSSRVLAVRLDWGDGSSDTVRLAVRSAQRGQQASVPLRHTYRRPGTYRLVLQTVPASACGTPTTTGTRIIVR